ncbi:2-octaprenyl-6-methoxyphenyl hydroxylase [Rhodovulum sulfidophilum]|uniref:UbiH/UbiF family hydroxylase n=1 Tax=Rhodovulum visakhapatnamense TaxID=364297 RepID=A0ABS1RD81_9RHOB|nr:UbiH/UbiF family hydroxylase [Rhodovulum visakhapatnamense]MBL3569249.1 UbiH/UbiF family hydroxylase [Rhodovulum visakhapatnamense]MBL3577475.1 UbiH/UbiF family hydroxylase [Rhodovulum visakhapatnamense]OLS44024.1 2-octaprenyl-6-methoxyphenyl hydroxylase [Rhodovulum sulfidophilum]
MTRISTDILISGGGVAGLTAAALFGTEGYSVICVDPAPPVTEETAEGADLRSTAFLQPSLAVLKAAGLWDRLAPFATDLQVMRIVDAGGKIPSPRITRDFNATDVSDLPFGWNLPNWLLRREMVRRLEDLPNVDFRPGTATTGVLTRDAEALVDLSDGTKVSARLLIGADGRNSPVREALGIGVRTMRYGQKALAFAVTHSEPHGNVSTEIHRSGGPFTLVPLPDRDGRPCSAIVWMERGPEALRLAALPEAEFNAEMTARSGAIYGPLRLETRRTVWPIISQVAHRMSGERTALIAEAAHVMPPIGAQGLNMSLADLRVLLDLCRAAPNRIGEDPMLDLYHRRRHPEVLARVTGIDLLNRASMQSAQPLRDLRAAGVASLYALKPVRRTLMRLGMGARG